MVDDSPGLGPRVGVPRVPTAFVPRPRLDVLLHDDLRLPVTLVSAPPGSGKTTLVASALGAHGGFASVLVDRRHNDAHRLAGVVVAALAGAGAVDAPGVAAVDRVRPAASLLDAAFAGVGRSGRRHVLSLDDVQELTSPEALDTLAYLVERAPSGLDVVLCSRADPPIRLTRLRLDGRLEEIRNDRLAFDATEAMQLLAVHGVRLTRSQSEAIWRRTQGWAAGLRLAAYALEREADPRELVDGVAATESAVVDYLLEELLTRQDEGLQRFLLHTSVAQRLTCDLAESLTGDPAAADRLAELERNGVVVAEADDTTWYRYHPLFGTLLGARLRHCHRDLADELHRRAGGWFLAHGMSREAEAQARVARDWAEVGRLAGRRWVDDAAAGADAVADQVATVPPPALMANAGLALLAAVAACRRADRGAADAYRAVVDDLTGDGSGPDAGPPPEARALLDIDYARAFGSDDRGRRAVAALSGSPGDVGAAERRPAGLAQVGALGAVALDLDEGLTESARKAAATLAFPAGVSRLAGEAEALLAVATAVEGQLAAAVDHAENVLAAGPSGRPVARHAASLALAVAHASAGEPRLALDALAGVEVVDGADGWLRRLDAALRMALRTAGTAVVERCPDGTPHPLVDRALVAVGVLEAVDPGGRVIPLGGPLERRVLRARHAWHERDAREVLEAAAADPDTGGHPRTGIERAALVALAADQHGDHERTVRELRAALSAGDATRIRAPLRLLAADLAAPLTTHHEALAPHQALGLDLVDRARVSPAPPFVEPLTEREVMVLRHLPSLMSNQEIADGMHVSVNTVKTHLKALYRKLGVTSRREAVQQGRALELL